MREDSENTNKPETMGVGIWEENREWLSRVIENLEFKAFW